MRRAWIGLALLSASWLFALGYYHDPNGAIWALLVSAGVGLFVGIDLHIPARIESVVAAALLAPVVLLAPWPWRAPVLLLVGGLLLCVAPIPRRWPRRLGLAALTAGMILTFQAAGMLAYESFTARSHELPWHLARMLHVAAQTLGIPAALDGTTLALYSIRHTHRLGTTWGLLLDPVTFSFLVGGVALLCLRTPATSFAGILRHTIPQLLALILCIALWLPVRAAFLVAVHMHRALRTPYEAPLALMGPFWNPWVLLLLLAGPILLAWRFVCMPIATTTRPIAAPKRSRRIVCVVMAFAAAVNAAVMFEEHSPSSRWVKPLWIGGLSIAGVGAALQVASGEPFPPDIIAAAAAGSFAGWCIPRLHRNFSDDDKPWKAVFTGNGLAIVY
jgi:hypothetical protein